MTADRRYDDREVGLILKRVAELHENDTGKPDARSMTKAEIEQVVTELGISQALVARAVSELSVRDIRNRESWWLGGKTDLMFEEVVDGSVDEPMLTQMLESLRRSLGDPGELKVEGGARIWSTGAGTTRRIYFTVVEQSGRTTLRLEERMPMDAQTTVGLSGVAGGFTGLMAVIPLKALVVKSVLLLAMGPSIGLGAAAGWLVGRALWRRRSGGREAQLRRTFTEIVGVANSRPALPSGSDEGDG